MTWIARNQRIFIFRKRREKWLLPHLGKMNQEVGRRALQWKTWSIYLQFNPHLLLTDRISLSDWHSGLQRSGTFSLLLESFSSATSLKLLGVFKSWCRCLDHTWTLRSKVFFEETSRALKMKLMELKCRVAYSWIEFYRKGNWSDALCVNNSFSNDVSYLFFFLLLFLVDIQANISLAFAFIFYILPGLDRKSSGYLFVYPGLINEVRR